MRVVMLSKTPLAGAPWEIMKCLNKYTDIKVRWISLKDRYRDGRVFPKDLIWGTNGTECLKAIREADVIHIHNEPFVHHNFYGKPVVAQFHSVPIRPTYNILSKKTRHNYTIMQPMQMREYKLPVLPNMIDVEEYLPINRDSERLKIVFAPTNTRKIGMIASKGMDEITKLLSQFNDKADIDIFRGVSYLDNLKRKQNSDILIDDVVGDTFHRTTLEGCCFGVAVITGSEYGDWITTDFNGLKRTLLDLIDNREKLMDAKQKCRKWVEENWHPKDLCRYYVDAYAKALGQ